MGVDPVLMRFGLPELLLRVILPLLPQESQTTVGEQARFTESWQACQILGSCRDLRFWPRHSATWPSPLPAALTCQMSRGQILYTPKITQMSKNSRKPYKNRAVGNKYLSKSQKNTTKIQKKNLGTQHAK